MKKPETYYCDFCGKEIRKPGPYTRLPAITAVPDDNFGKPQEVLGWPLLDICPECAKKATNIHVDYDGKNPRIEEK